MAKAKAKSNETPKKSGGFLKKAVITLVVLGLLGFTGLAAAPFFIDWAAVKDKATAQLSKTLGRQVKVGDIEVGLFTGVKLKDILVANGRGFSRKPLFSNKEAEVKFSLVSVLMSLLKGKAVIDRIRFVEPTILIEKDAKGKFNFSDMVKSSASKVPAASAKKEESKDGGPAVLPEINSLEIENAQFTFRGPDRKAHGFENLNFKLTGFSLAGGGKSLLEISLKAQSEGKEIPVNFRALFNMDLPKDSLQLHEWSLNLPSIETGGEGKIAALSGNPQLDVLSKTTLRLDSLVKDLLPPSALKQYPPGLRTKGTIAAAVRLIGPADDPLSGKAKGKISFKDVGVSYGDYPAMDSLNGEIHVDPTKLVINPFDFNMAGSPVSLKVAATYTLENLMGPQDKLRMALKYEVTSPKLILDPLLALSAEEEEAAAKTSGGSKTASKPVDYRKKIPAGVSLEGKVQVDKFQIRKIETGKMTHVLTLKNRKGSSDLRMNLFEGSLASKANIDFNVPGTTYSFNGLMKNVQISPLADGWAASYPEKKRWSKFAKDLKGKVSGALNFDVKGTGRDTRLDPLVKAMNMSGSFSLSKAELKQVDMLKAIGAVLPVTGAKELLSKETYLDYLGGDIRMKDGKFVWSNVRGGSGKNLRGGDLYIESKGVFLPPDGAIDATVTPHFNPAMKGFKLSDPRMHAAFSDKQGWLRYAVKYKGSNLDTAKADYSEGAKQAAKQAVQNEVDRAKEELKKKAEEEAKKQLQQKGQDLLKGLFGK